MNDASIETARAITIGLADPAVLLDRDLRPIEFNQRYASLAGHRARRILAMIQTEQPIFDLLARADGQDTQLARRALDSARPINLAEVHLRNGAGERFTVMQSFIPIAGQSGEPGAVLVIYRDTSAEARVQRRFQHLAKREQSRAEELEAKVAQRTEQLSEALEQLSHLSNTDSLTGLLNRRAFDERAQAQWQAARQSGRNLAILMCDLDRFKQVNDRYGHPAGDRILAATAAALTSAVRATDTVARLGGEEFAIVLPNSAADAVEEVAKRCAQNVRALRVEAMIPGFEGRQTISIGVVVSRNRDQTVASLLARADRALYRAKRAGRDAVVACDESARHRQVVATRAPELPREARS